jgi:hypothetical protein
MDQVRRHRPPPNPDYPRFLRNVGSSNSEEHGVEIL